MAKMKSIWSKKAEIGTLQSVVIALIVIGIVLGVGFIVLETFEEIQGTTVGSVENETVSSVSNVTCSYVAFNHTTNDTFCYNTFTVTSVTNASTGDMVLNSANYTTQPATGCIQSITENIYALEDWNITYTYKHDDGAGCEGLNETIEATATIPTWLAIIVLLLIVGILLFLVFKAVPQFTSGHPTGAEGSIAQI